MHLGNLHLSSCGGEVAQTRESKRGSNQGICHVAEDGQEKDGIG